MCASLALCPVPAASACCWRSRWSTPATCTSSAATTRPRTSTRCSGSAWSASSGWATRTASGAAAGLLRGRAGSRLLLRGSQPLPPVHAGPCLINLMPPRPLPQGVEAHQRAVQLAAARGADRGQDPVHARRHWALHQPGARVHAPMVVQGGATRSLGAWRPAAIRRLRSKQTSPPARQTSPFSTPPTPSAPGQPPVIPQIDQIAALQRPITMEEGGPVLMDLLWSDPTTNDGVQVCARGGGVTRLRGVRVGWGGRRTPSCPPPSCKPA